MLLSGFIDAFREFQSLEMAIKELVRKFDRIQLNGTYQAELEAPLKELVAAFWELEQLMRPFGKTGCLCGTSFPAS